MRKDGDLNETKDISMSKVDRRSRQTEKIKSRDACVLARHLQSE